METTAAGDTVEPVKIGRNDSCPCGSGKKYKKCHLGRDRAASVTDLGARDEDGRLIGRPFIDQVYEGKRFRAVGSGMIARKPAETNEEFFVNVLAGMLGGEWKAEQDKLDDASRHPVATWTDAWDALRKGGGAHVPGRRDEGNDRYSMTATGNLAALINLAYDVYTLRHAMVIEQDDPLVKRLAHPLGFQGARYEIAVAAICVRAGYQLEWTADVTRKLPEFIGRKPSVEIAVEAKSRVRPGVLGQPGVPPSTDSLKPDVARLLRDALEKETDRRPYVVFIDLNLPTTDRHLSETALQSVAENVFRGRPEATHESPDRFGVMFLTNFAWHWDEGEDAGPAERMIVLPFYTDSPVPYEEREVLWEAVTQYGDIPPSPQ